MWDILGGLSILVIVIGIYVYYGRKTFNFIRRQIGLRQIIKHQEVQQVVNSMTQEDLKNYGDWMNKKIKQENDDKRKGKFRF